MGRAVRNTATKSPSQRVREIRYGSWDDSILQRVGVVSGYLVFLRPSTCFGQRRALEEDEGGFDPPYRHAAADGPPIDQVTRLQAAQAATKSCPERDGASLRSVDSDGENGGTDGCGSRRQNANDWLLPGSGCGETGSNQSKGGCRLGNFVPSCRNAKVPAPDLRPRPGLNPSVDGQRYYRTRCSGCVPDRNSRKPSSTPDSAAVDRAPPFSHDVRITVIKP